MTITVVTPTNVQPSTNFTINGSLTSYSRAPTLTYIDNPVVIPATNLKATPGATQIALTWTASTPLAWKSLPTGATVSTNSFLFSHPGVATGTYTTAVSDGTVSGITASYVISQMITHVTVTAKLNQVITDLNGIIADVAKLQP